MVLHYAVGKRVGKDIQSKRRGYHILFVFFGCLVALAALFSMWSNLLVPNKQPVEPSFVTNATQKRSDAAKYHSTSPYNLTEPYWFMTSNDSCPLYHMGLILGDDKFTSHSYHNMYCEVFRDFKATQKKIRMLEIGFGCGHNNHGVSARIWKSFFSNGGSDVNLYEIDLDTPMHKNCSKNFLLEHPNIVSKLYLGDQADKPFLRRVVNDSGGLYDIMLDDGGHGDWHQRPTFAVMWDHVMPGMRNSTMITTHHPFPTIANTLYIAIYVSYLIDPRRYLNGVFVLFQGDCMLLRICKSVRRSYG